MGLGRAAGDVFFGLIGFRHETRAARARAGRKRRTQAGTHALKLGWVSARSSLRVWNQGKRVLGWARGVWVRGRRGWVGGMMCRQPAGESRLQALSELDHSGWVGCLTGLGVWDEHALQGSLTLWIIAPSPLCGAFLLRLREVVTTARSRSGGQALKQGPA